MAPTATRRSRLTPQSTIALIELSKRDVLWFERLHRHGPLTSAHLLAYSRIVLGYNDEQAKHRLGELFHEENTPHGGRYLVRPEEQEHTRHFLNNKLVYDLSKYGYKALEDAELLREYPPSHALGQQFHHDFMGA